MKQNKTNYKENLLTPGQKSVFKALLQTGNITEAAEISKVSRGTIYRYLSEPKFKKVVNDAQFEMLSLAIGELQKAAHEAATILINLAKDSETPASVKLSACKVILESGFKGAELLHLEERLSLLEEAEND